MNTGGALSANVPGNVWNPIIWPFKFSFAFGFFLFTMQTVVETIKSALTLLGHDVPAPVLPKGIH